MCCLLLFDLIILIFRGLRRVIGGMWSRQIRARYIRARNLSIIVQIPLVHWKIVANGPIFGIQAHEVFVLIFLTIFIFCFHPVDPQNKFHNKNRIDIMPRLYAK